MLTLSYTHHVTEGGEGERNIEMRWDERDTYIECMVERERDNETRRWTDYGREGRVRDTMRK